MRPIILTSSTNRLKKNNQTMNYQVSDLAYACYTHVSMMLLNILVSNVDLKKFIILTIKH